MKAKGPRAAPGKGKKRNGSRLEVTRRLPRHEEVTLWLREQIESRCYVQGDRLPSEKALQQRFRVSRITVRRALQTLEADGLVYRRQGVGSFAANPRLRQGLVRLTDFSEDMAQAGLEPSSRILFQGEEVLGRQIASCLGLEEGVPCVRLDRLRLGDGEPIAFDQTWLPYEYGKLLEGRDLIRDTIYRILGADCGIAILRGHYRIEAVEAEPEVAEVLGVERRKPLLLISRLSYTSQNKAVYFQKRYYRSDRVVYEVELERTSRHEGGTVPVGMPLRSFAPVFSREGEKSKGKNRT
ncbi:HTH-type transcriptional repressor YvoA [Methylacidimicrobium cyclopophantes]|uniref:HTH-type transcriptional repressor YvoA n=1 Tax=Methylacidimicrobium cyclopophantes TaxID=1041766 RepID=A0A5E6M4U3_9BACT|nr:GntR family transcriptional regulator [Methylacidimicrobium cyclopophantes]VVM04354.1 HTH-type transcriptional repressor YvoA [Methylacidimicrobium cyclopophantes]